MPKEKQEIRFIRELCRDLSEEEIQAAEEHFARYIMRSFEIFQRHLDNNGSNNAASDSTKNDMGDIVF